MASLQATHNMIMTKLTELNQKLQTAFLKLNLSKQANGTSEQNELITNY